MNYSDRPLISNSRQRSAKMLSPQVLSNILDTCTKRIALAGFGLAEFPIICASQAFVAV
jgi:hypothetical protein